MRKEVWRNFDFWLFSCVVILSIFGIVMIQSAIAGNEVLADLIPRQIVFVAVGFVVMIVTALIDYQ